VAHFLRSDQRLWFQRLPLRLSFDAGSLHIEGAVPSLAMKRNVLRLAAAHPAVWRVTERLRITPAALMTDPELRDQVVDALLEDGAFADCSIFKRSKGGLALVQRQGDGQGELTVGVERGVVKLEGKLATRGQQRLAGVLAWWLPGTTDVDNAIRVASDETDEDAAITSAVQQALDKDPHIDASQVRVETRSKVVKLAGLVWSAEERDGAEKDAWYVLGVVDVVNALVAAPT
jgi:osmotically-inducible protein OsmY